MTRIGSGGRPPVESDGNGGPSSTPTASSDLRTKEGVQRFREAAAEENVPAQVVDSFERAAPLLEKQLQAMSGQALAVKINFTSEDLAQLAGMFAVIIRGHPRADRRERARLFASAILKSKRFGKVLANAAKADLEKMFDTIADQLDSSPVFAQLVDEVTDGVRRSPLG